MLLATFRDALPKRSFPISCRYVLSIFFNGFQGNFSVYQEKGPKLKETVRCTIKCIKTTLDKVKGGIKSNLLRILTTNLLKKKIGWF